MPKVGTFVLLNSFGILFSLGNYNQWIRKQGRGGFSRNLSALNTVNESISPSTPFDFPVDFQEQGSWLGWGVERAAVAALRQAPVPSTTQLQPPLRMTRGPSGPSVQSPC